MYQFVVTMWEGERFYFACYLHLPTQSHSNDDTQRKEATKAKREMGSHPQFAVIDIKLCFVYLCFTAEVKVRGIFPSHSPHSY